jgi:uncharacterized protein (DUF433 family)
MKTLITISPDIQSGAPVFYNTRVPVRNLFDYLKAGDSVDDFLKDFPSVKKSQVISLLKFIENTLSFSGSSHGQVFA